MLFDFLLNYAVLFQENENLSQVAAYEETKQLNETNSRLGANFSTSTLTGWERAAAGAGVEVVAEWESGGERSRASRGPNSSGA